MGVAGSVRVDTNLEMRGMGYEVGAEWFVIDVKYRSMYRATLGNATAGEGDANYIESAII